MCQMECRGPFQHSKIWVLGEEAFFALLVNNNLPPPLMLRNGVHLLSIQPLANILIATRPVLKYDWLSRIQKTLLCTHSYTH